MNAVLSEILRSGRVRRPSGEEVEVRANVTPAEGAFLQGLVEELRPRTSLEVGLAYGISALYLCDALERVAAETHIVIDPNQFGGEWGDSWQGVGLENLKRAGHEERIEFHDEPSFRALPKLEAEGKTLDFAFIDGWHTFDFTLVDFFYIDRMLRPGGVVVIDDAQWPSVRKAVRYALTNRGYRVRACHVPEGAPAYRRQRLLARLARAAGPLQALLKPEWTRSDPALGIPPAATCVALEKTGDDERDWTFHREF